VQCIFIAFDSIYLALTFVFKCVSLLDVWSKHMSYWCWWTFDALVVYLERCNARDFSRCGLTWCVPAGMKWDGKDFFSGTGGWKIMKSVADGCNLYPAQLATTCSTATTPELWTTRRLLSWIAVEQIADRLTSSLTRQPSYTAGVNCDHPECRPVPARPAWLVSVGTRAPD